MDIVLDEILFSLRKVIFNLILNIDYFQLDRTGGPQ